MIFMDTIDLILYFQFDSYILTTCNCRISKIFVHRVVNPWLYYDLIYAFSWSAFKERRYLKILHDFTDSVIKKREKNFKASDLDNVECNDGYKSKKRLAMLDLLIDYKLKTGRIDDAGIREEVDTFMFEVIYLLVIYIYY